MGAASASRIRGVVSSRRCLGVKVTVESHTIISGKMFGGFRKLMFLLLLVLPVIISTSNADGMKAYADEDDIDGDDEDDILEEDEEEKAVMEMGTSPKGDVDYDWIPKETLNELRKTPRTSPRQRKANRDSDS